MRCPVRSLRGSQRGWNLRRVEIGRIHLTNEPLSLPVIRTNKVARPSISADESLISLDHADVSGKFSPAWRALPNQGISHLSGTEQLGLSLQDAKEHHSQGKQPNPQMI